MLDWIKKHDGDANHPMRNPVAAAKLLAEMRQADPVAALNELSAWLDAVKGIPGEDEKIRSDILSLIQEASVAHVSALLAQILARTADRQAAHESNWNTLNHYLRELSGTLCASASALLQQAAANPSLQPAAAAGAARGLHACRMLAKLCFVRYMSVQPKVWRMAYGVHGDAEKAHCAATPIRLHASQKTLTSATQELLRLLLLQSSAPEMMSPMQIEAADRVVEQLSEEFTLRPQGVTDNPFCFDPASEGPPWRAVAQPPQPHAEIRFFGAGTGYDALGRLYKQVATTKTADIKALGKDIPLHEQISAIRHLGMFWGEATRYTPPARSPVTGSLQIVHGYAQIWQHLSRVRAAPSELTLAEDGDVAAQAPETWTQHDAGGIELGAEIPRSSNDWARCGDVVGVSKHGDAECWLGVIRSMHAEPGRNLHASIAVLSRDPQAVQLLALLEQGEESAYSGEASRQFVINRVRAIILSDGSAAPQQPNLLLPPEQWKEERVFEATIEGAERYLRCAQLLRRGDDYVRASFKWVPKPD